MATFWERAAHSVGRVFSLYFFYFFFFFFFVISRFGFESGVLFLIAPVPVHCLRVTFIAVWSKLRK